MEVKQSSGEAVETCKTYKETLDSVRAEGGSSDSLQRFVVGSYIASTGIVLSVLMLSFTLCIAIYMTCSESKDKSAAGQVMVGFAALLLFLVGISWYVYCIETNSGVKTRDWKHLSFGYYAVLLAALFSIGSIFDLKREFSPETPEGAPHRAQAEDDEYWTV